jgi:hypothetical protein
MYRIILWMLFAFCWIVWQISWPVAIFQCKPVSAAWGEPGDVRKPSYQPRRITFSGTLLTIGGIHHSVRKGRK